METKLGVNGRPVVERALRGLGYSVREREGNISAFKFFGDKRIHILIELDAMGEVHKTSLVNVHAEPARMPKQLHHRTENGGTFVMEAWDVIEAELSKEKRSRDL